MSELGFTSPREMAAALFIIGGLIFFIGSGIGMLRLPDFYSRIHASGNSETLGCMLTFIGLMIYEGATLTSLKIAFVFLLVFMANPIGSHILSKSAYKSGHPIWTLKTKGAKKLLGLAGPDHSIDEPVGHLEKEENNGNLYDRSHSSGFPDSDHLRGHLLQGYPLRRHHLQRVQLLCGAPVPHDGFSGCGFHRSGHWYDLYDLLRSIAEEN